MGPKSKENLGVNPKVFCIIIFRFFEEAYLGDEKWCFLDKKIILTRGLPPGIDFKSFRKNTKKENKNERRYRNDHPCYCRVS